LTWTVLLDSSEPPDAAPRDRFESVHRSLMRVAHCLGWYYPDSTGGTEAYVEGLARALHRADARSVIIAASDSTAGESYEVSGSKVFRYPAYGSDLEIIRGFRPHDGFDLFKKALEDSEAEVYHQHSWTMNCGIHHLRYAKSIGLGTVLTLHTPAAFCVRGTLYRNGRSVCDGRLLERRCGVCLANAKRAPPMLSRLLSHVPDALSDKALKTPGFGKIGSALATRSLVRKHSEAFRDAQQAADRIVVLAKWAYEMLRRNGVAREQLVLSRHGITHGFDSTNSAAGIPDGNSSKPLVLGFVGRADPVKGIDVLIRAVKGLPRELPLELRLHAVARQHRSVAYLDDLRALADRDPRILFLDPVPGPSVRKLMTGFDLLAVPSRSLETGPLVVIEALSVGVPVIGSNLGGISEYVHGGSNGILLPPDDVEAWRSSIRAMCENRMALPRVNTLPGNTRTTTDVATEMKHVYESILSAEGSRMRPHSSTHARRVGDCVFKS
jgi:glycosyltransferase involved in cell wall biosynthesis